MLNKIRYSIKKFQLNLNNQVVLTEAATGDYSCTAIIADLAGAKRVYALAKESKYGTYKDIEDTYKEYFKSNSKSSIKIIKSLEEIEEKVDIVTNSGFVRPLNKTLLPYLHYKSVITLMYEPWEFRDSDIDLDTFYSAGIKVYGTNEHDSKLLTMDYIGITALYLLLDLKVSYFSPFKILVLGTKEFTEPIERILTVNNYDVKTVNDYSNSFDKYDEYDIFIIAEHKDKRYVIGSNDAFINKDRLKKEQKVIHICGNVDLDGVKSFYIPKNPAPFGYMSYRTDFVDNMAVIDLQTGSLKVAEGMIEANRLGLVDKEYKDFLEKNYNALSFNNKRYW